MTEDIFKEAPVEEISTEEKSDDMIEEAEEFEPFSPSIPTESPKEKLERQGTRKIVCEPTKEKDEDGNLIYGYTDLTIKEIGFTRPKTLDKENNKIEPKFSLNNPEAKFYPGKLIVKFKEENLIEYYPNFKYFLDRKTGKMSNLAKVYRTGKSVVSKLFTLAVAKMGKPMDEISDPEFYDFLVDKKVKVQTVVGIYKNEPWFRNDIVEIY